MIWSSFVSGLVVGAILAGVVYVALLRRMDRKDEEFRKQSRQRIDELSRSDSEFQRATRERLDELAEWSCRRLDDASKEAGPPPRRMS